MPCHQHVPANPATGYKRSFEGVKVRALWCAGGEEYAKYKQQVVELLKAGQLVVQMMAAEETISMPDGSRKATFTQETWDMVCIIGLVAIGLICRDNLYSCQQAIAHPAKAKVLFHGTEGRGGGDS